MIMLWFARLFISVAGSQQSLRMAANQRGHTPLNCVERIIRLKAGEEDTVARLLGVELELEINGMGRRTGKVSVHLPRA
jgi:hypothetical protein